MFNSLKNVSLIRVSGHRKPLKFTPAKSGRTELPASDEGELAAIARATRHGYPIYILRTTAGVTLDVMLDKAKAMKTRDAVVDRLGSGGIGVQLFERRSTNLLPL